MRSDSPSLEFHPLTLERWRDLEILFGKHGAYGGCWCMWWRCTRSEFQRNHGEGNRRAMKKIVASGQPTGILAYAAGEPAGWCSVAPRETYPSLERSRVLKRIDDRPVWSIVCLFVGARHRGKGLAEALVRAAVEFARGRGATVVEAYPTPSRGSPLPPVSSYMGTPEMFERAGFVEVARPSRAKVVMRHGARGRDRRTATPVAERPLILVPPRETGSLFVDVERLPREATRQRRGYRNTRARSITSPSKMGDR